MADPAAVEDAIGRWLRHLRGPRVDLVSVIRAASGYSNETLVITAEPGPERLVLRLPTSPPLFPDYDFAGQAAVQHRAAEHGVPAPVPAFVEPDQRWLGRPFLVMPFVEGTVPSETPAFDPWVTGASADEQATLRRNFIDIVAAIHRVPTAAGRPLDAEVGWWAHYLEWALEGRRVTTVSDALAWCRAHVPVEQPSPSLLWGDVRLGNVIFDEDRQVQAVIDWEMSGAGPAELDVGWLYALEEVQEQLFGRRVPGFPDRAKDQSRYEAGLGRRLGDLDWYETFGLARAVAINLRQAILAERAGRTDPPLRRDQSVGALVGRTDQLIRPTGSRGSGLDLQQQSVSRRTS